MRSHKFASHAPYLKGYQRISSPTEANKIRKKNPWNSTLMVVFMEVRCWLCGPLPQKGLCNFIFLLPPVCITAPSTCTPKLGLQMTPLKKPLRISCPVLIKTSNLNLCIGTLYSEWWPKKKFPPLLLDWREGIYAWDSKSPSVLQHRAPLSGTL